MIVNKEEVDYLHLPPKTVLADKYRIEDRLAERSNLSIVYLATHLGMEAKVVIKEFFPREFVLRDLDGTTVVCKQSSQREKFKQEKEVFLQEAEVMNQLTSQYTARCYESFKANNTGYLVMKYYRGRDLNYYFQQDIGLFTFLEQVFFPLLKTVANLHDQGYIHRDLKPENIIMYLDRPILIDFGSALQYRQPTEKSKVLTPGYSPLEFYSSEAEQGPFSDIYSLAAILYRFCTGKLPLEAADRIIQDELTSVKELTSGPAEELNEFIMRNLALDSERRNQSVSAFRANLWKKLAKLKARRWVLNLVD